MSLKTLVFNGAGAGAGHTNLIALIDGENVVAQRLMAGRGASEQFAPLVRDLLHEAGWAGAPDLVAAVVGPGSFTGLRASLSLAAGLSAGWGCPVVGVTLGAAIRATLGRPDVTCVSVARRGRVFVDSPEGAVIAVQTDVLDASCWKAAAGDAVAEVSGLSCEVLDCVAPTALGILHAARDGRSRPLMPLYVDPPEAKPPAAGLRPAPL